VTAGESGRLATEALAHWGGSGRPRLLAERENAVFAVGLPDGRRAVLRLHRPGYQDEAAIRSELWWLAALAEAGQPVARPIATPAGDELVRLSDGRVATMLSWVEGRPMGAAGVPLAGGRALQFRRHRALGRALAALHAASDRLTLPPWFTRPRWDAAGLVGEDPVWGRFWEHPAATAPERALLGAARAAAARVLADHAAAGADMGLIHADVLRENVLWQGRRLALIDFDDAGFGFRLYDLGTALSQALAEPALPDLAAALAEGYAALRPLGAAGRALLPWFTLLRCCASVAWTAPRLPPGDPRHRAYLDRALGAARVLLAGGDLWAEGVGRRAEA
jgi:Ser/Thr protein kinase RdoA (MazF antagonist)